MKTILLSDEFEFEIIFEEHGSQSSKGTISLVMMVWGYISKLVVCTCGKAPSVLKCMNKF